MLWQEEATCLHGCVALESVCKDKQLTPYPQGINSFYLITMNPQIPAIWNTGPWTNFVSFFYVIGAQASIVTKEVKRKGNVLDLSSMPHPAIWFLFKLQWKIHCWWNAGLNELFGHHIRDMHVCSCLWSLVDTLPSPCPVIKHIKEWVFAW
jgi:hypothetical protein